MLTSQLKSTIDIDMFCFIRNGVVGTYLYQSALVFLQHAIGSRSIIICIPMGSCSTFQ